MHNETSRSELIIAIPSDNSEASVSFKNADGISSRKTVAVEDLITSLADRYQFSTGIVPNATRYYSGSQNSYSILLEYPAKIRRFLRFVPARADEVGWENYEPDVLQIPFPVVLFYFQVRKEQLVRTNVRAASSRIQSMDSELYHFPFGNVYRDGRVCWGTTNKLPQIMEPNHLIGVANMFLDLPYNGDLVGDGGNTFRSPASVAVTNFWSLISFLENKDSFDNNILVSTGTLLSEMVRGEE